MNRAALAALADSWEATDAVTLLRSYGYGTAPEVGR